MSALYGPPPSPLQIAVPSGLADQPGAWVLTLGLGAALLAMGVWQRRRGWGYPALMAGLVCLLTAPALGMVQGTVWGAWPTVDKAGAYLFYLRGVGTAPFAADALDDPALKLIGIQVAHLWPTAALDLLLSPHGAFNAQALLHVWLAWLCAWLLIREVGARPWAALLAAAPFALGLHVFRDVNYYTIEKSGVFGVPLFLWALLRARRLGGRWLALPPLLLGSLAFYNEYLALLGAALAGLWLLSFWSRRALVVVGACVLALIPVAVLQALLFRDAGALADPERFLWERAALDTLSLWPPAWYHLELWRALNLPLVLLGALCIWRARARPEARWAAGAVVLLGLLALGPRLQGDQATGIPNHLYMACWEIIPGFWRIARPEFLFEGAYLALLVAAGVAISRLVSRTRWLALLSAALLAGWLWGVRGHPAYPGFTSPVEVNLPEGWERGVFEATAR
ncbi:MAG: hypothetical protein ABIO70_13195 [Pseudomonadota bacterium]